MSCEDVDVEVAPLCARDPLGNPLRLCQVPADCPYPCRMTFPHLHSIILPELRNDEELP